MIPALLVSVLLAADPVAAAPESPASEAPPELELVIPAKMLESLLEAAAPFERKITQQVVLMGFSQKVNVDLRLTSPRVEVTPKGVRVTFDYVLKGPGGITSRGRATPKMELRPIPDKGIIEGRLTGAKLSATGGIEVPVEDLLEPVQIPASASGPLVLGDKKIQAEGRAREVVLEDGLIRVRGTWDFKRAEEKSEDSSVADDR